MRQEFGVVNKLKKQVTLTTELKNEQNARNTQTIVSSLEDENILISKTESIQNKYDCSFTRCDCPRCRNMNGN